MRHPLRLLLATFLFTAIYLLLFPVPTGNELVLEREWVVDSGTIPVASAGPAHGTELIPVEFTNSFSYLAGSGEVAHRWPIPHRVALGDTGFVVFGREPEQLVIQESDGSYVTTIPQSGYPRFVDNTIYVQSGGDTIVTAYTADGAKRWAAELAGPVSSIRAAGGVSVLGQLSGGIVAIGESGERIEVEDRDNPFLQTVYGTAVHGPTGSVAVVYGPDPPRLVYYRYRTDQLVPVLRVTLGDDPGARVATAISDDAGVVMVDDGGIRIVDVVSGDEVPVATDHPLARIAPVGEHGMAAALGVGRERDPQHGFRFPAELILFDYDGIVPVRSAIRGDRLELITRDTEMFLVVDERVLKFTVAMR